MTISDAAATGTVYHEAFHSVIDILLNEDEINSLFVAGARKYGIERDSLNNELAIEENLAEDFRRYVQREQAYKKDLEQSSGLFKVFKILKHTVKTWLENTSYINNMFYRINQGQMANRSLRGNRNVERYNQYTAEEKAILDKAPRDSKGRLLAPNGKPSNLTEKQYAQVRTKAFKEWFGDWEKGLTVQQDDKSYYRGQYDEPIIDKDGNLRLKGRRDDLYNRVGYSVETGVSAATDMITANEYGETRYQAYIGDIEDKYGELDNSWEKEEEINEIIEHGYYLIQFPKNISNEVIKEAGEVKLVGDVIIPKGSYVIQHITNDNIETIATATNNASKVVDENGEPLVVYHGSKAIFNIFDSSKSESRQYLSQQIKPTNFFSSDKTVADFFALTENQSLASQISKSISIVLDAFAGENIDEDILDDEVWTEAARRTGKSKEFVKDFWDNKVPREYKMHDEFGYTRMKDPDIEKYKYNVFINMKNPIIVDDKGERADRFIEANKDVLNNNDEIIIININETVGKEDKSTDYLVRNPNQIKSATENIGTFSTENDDIKYREAGITPEDIQQYHRERLDYSNLDNTQKALLEDRGISEEHYSFLT